MEIPEVHIITGLVSAAKNIYRCVERAGYLVAVIWKIYVKGGFYSYIY